MTRLILAVMVLVVMSQFAEAGYPEKVYQRAWCAKNAGQVDVRLDDSSRVDCLTASHAVVVDFAVKWAEAVGEALYYAAKTMKAPGVVLITEDENDLIHLPKIRLIAEKHKLKLWEMSPDDI